MIDVDKEPAVSPTETIAEGHQWCSFAKRAFDEGRDVPKSGEMHRSCGYCAAKVMAYGFCSVCFPAGSTPTFAICGPTTGRNCMQRHSNGATPTHVMHKRPREAKEAKVEPQTTTKGQGGDGSSQGKRRARS